jgi:hypothetical protein
MDIAVETANAISEVKRAEQNFPANRNIEPAHMNLGSWVPLRHVQTGRLRHSRSTWNVVLHVRGMHATCIAKLHTLSRIHKT